jgi:hypothetical protein
MGGVVSMILRLFNTVVVLLVLILVAHLVLDGSDSPGPGPNPITPVVAGLHVLVVEETGLDRLWNYNDKRLDEFADKNCAKANGAPEFRIYDKDTDLTHASRDWQEAMADAKKHEGELPWLETWGTRKQRVSQKLPLSADDTLKVLESHRK